MGSISRCPPADAPRPNLHRKLQLRRDGMLVYVVKRFLLMIPTLLGAAVLVFLLMRAIPGDVCTLRMATGGGGIDPSVLKACQAEVGTDQPMFVQFLAFL